jgi:hypothetical protein
LDIKAAITARAGDFTAAALMAFGQAGLATGS